jgi:WD40 repeat protein
MPHQEVALNVKKMMPLLLLGIALILLLGAYTLANMWLTNFTKDFAEEWNKPIPIPRGTPAAQTWQFNSPVKEVEFHPAGNAIAVLRGDGTLEMREAPGGKVLHSVLASGKEIAYSGEQSMGSLAFGRDGQLLATAVSSYTMSPNTYSDIQSPETIAGEWEVDVTLWRVQTSEDSEHAPYNIVPTRTLTHTTALTHSGRSDYIPVPNTLAFSPDGQTLAAGNTDGSVTVWDVDSGQIALSLVGTSYMLGSHSEIKGLAWSADGNTLITGDYDETVTKYRMPDGKLVASENHYDKHPRGHTTYVFSYIFSPDGQYEATASWAHEIALWRLSDGSLLRTVGSMDGPRHLSTIWSMAFSPDSELIASGGGLESCDSGCGSSDPSVRIWRLADGQQLALYSGHTDMVTTIAWSPDGRSVISGSKDGTVRLWDTSNLR